MDKTIEIVLTCPQCDWHTRYTSKMIKNNEVFDEDPMGERAFCHRQDYKTHFMRKHQPVPDPVISEEEWWSK